VNTAEVVTSVNDLTFSLNTLTIDCS